MRKTFALILALGVVLTACAGSDAGESGEFAEETMVESGGDEGELSEPTADDAGNVRVDF